MKPDNPPAFPSLSPPGSWDDPGHGMTLRDWFAGQALVELSSLIEVNNPGTYKVVASFSYQLADALLAERDNHND